ncbi:MAG: class I SAM-dependent methyltransferase [Candidatus Rokuibacteriota bacterium]
MDIHHFYDRHPISEEQVLAAVARRRGGGEEGTLGAEDLFDFDQDHYGGVAAVEALAARARISAASRTLDLGAGLGGPARFLATRRACRVVGLELNANRAAGGARLTRRVGLAGRVWLIRGDAQQLPFADASFDACISQEALLHISDKAAALAGCRRVLRPGGRVAFTDWTANPRLADRERNQLHAWMAATTLQTLTSYPDLIRHAGFAWAEAEDLSPEWRAILRQRVTRFRSLRQDLVARLGEPRYREYDQLYTFLVTLVDQGKLGSGRFWAAR